MKALVLCFSIAALISFTACGNKRNSTVAVNRSGQQVDNSGGFGGAMYNETPQTGVVGGAYKYLQSDRLLLHEEGTDKRVYIQFKLVLRNQSTAKTKVAQKQYYLFYDEYLTCDDGTPLDQRTFHTVVTDAWVGGRSKITLNNIGSLEKTGKKSDANFLLTLTKYLNEQDNFLTTTDAQGKVVPVSWALSVKRSDTSVDKLLSATYPQTAKTALVTKFDNANPKTCANAKPTGAIITTDGAGKVVKPASATAAVTKSSLDPSSAPLSQYLDPSATEEDSSQEAEGL